ncbi:MAG TPA: M23 family metallopeptidase [Gaiellaceae bacterium]|nr:M23 family metallopeptidase [Gaiellaceae bacterium]
MQEWQRHPSILTAVVAVAVAALVAPAVAGAWTWPVAGPVLRGFLFSEEDPLAPGQHRGIDIQGVTGDSVLAPASGTVTFVGRVAANGLTVTIETSDGYTVTLLHLGSSLVAAGAAVDEGQPVATVGSSGVPEYAVPYLQLGVRLTSDPEGYRDPQGFLPPPASPDVPPQLAPEGDPRPTPALPPSPATPPPAAAPAPSPNDRAVPQRTSAPVGSTSARPDVQPSSGTIVRRGAQAGVEAGRSSAVAPIAPSSSALATSGVFGRHPVEPIVPPAPASLPPSSRRVAPQAYAAPRPAVAPQPLATWVRPSDLFAASAGHASAAADHGSKLPPVAVVALLLAVALAFALCAREFVRRAARIIGGDALLPDNADLLRELEPAHRARVHDDRRGRSRPAPQAAR